jgi:hypothetical protein
MTRTLRLVSLSLSVALALVATGAPAFAGGIVDPAPIAPNNFFFGQVNHQTAGATIGVVCLGPVASGQNGHPAAGQTVDAIPTTPPTSTTAGYTGTAANSIDVTILPTSPVVVTVLHDWVVTAPISTALTLPCSGTGTVRFTPVPTSPTARSAVVTVTFVSQT